MLLTFYLIGDGTFVKVVLNYYCHRLFTVDFNISLSRLLLQRNSLLDVS